MEWITTSTILERLQDGKDAAVWGRFIDRFRKPLEAFARRFDLTDADAQDVAQETLSAFFEAYRAGRYDRTAGRLSSWLFGIAYRQSANAKRRIVRDGKHRAAAGDRTGFWDHVPDEHEASAAWDADWERATMEACLDQAKSEVAPNTFRAFEMIVREGRPPEAAAKELGMTLDAVYVAKHRVLKRLSALAAQFRGEDGP